MSESLVMPELDYAKRPVSHGFYAHTKITPNVSGDVSCTSAGGTETVFDIPAKCVNFGKSYLNFYATVKAQDATYYSFTQADCMPFIRQIQLYTRNNVILCDIVNFSKYHKTVNRYETPYDDYITRDGLTVQTTATTANAYGAGVFQGLAPCNAPDTDDEAQRPDNTTIFKNYIEAQPIAISGANTARAFTVRFPLSDIFNSILGMDKDLFFGEIVNVKIVWNSSTLITWRGTASTNPTTAQAVLYSTGSADTITLSDVHLLLAVEQNPVIVQSIKDKVDSGNFNISIPYVLSNKINQGASTQQATTVKYSRGHGQKLQKVYFTAYNNTETLSTMYDHSNINDAKISSMIISLNNQRLNQFNLDTTNLDDYLQMKPYIKGSACLSSNEYQANWMYLVNFINNSCPSDVLPAPESNLIDGLPLDEEQMLTFDCTTAGNALNHYVFAITQKNLTISSAGSILQ